MKLTRLQRRLIALHGALERARDELTETEYRAFVWIATSRIGNEAARLTVREVFEALEEDPAA